MKIMHVSYKMNLGGIENFLMNVLRNSDKNKDEYVVLTYSSEKFYFEEELNDLGVRILRISSPDEVSVISHISELKKIIKAEGVDVIHAHTYVNSAYVLCAAWAVGVKVRISHSHTTLASTEKRLKKKIKWGIAKLLIGIFSTQRIACSTEAGMALFGQRNFIVVLNGIQLSKFYFNNKTREEYRNNLGFHSDTLVLGHVGRFDTPKNHTFLLDIFSAYHELNPNSKLILVGSGKLENVIKQKIADNRIGGDVILLGDRNDVSSLLNAFDIFLFPSLYEGLPLSLVEVQANGLSSMVSDVVSPEIKLTETIHFYSLAMSSREWAQQIPDLTLKRYDISDSDSLKLYSIKNTVLTLMRIYERGLELYEK